MLIENDSNLSHPSSHLIDIHNRWCVPQGVKHKPCRMATSYDKLDSFCDFHLIPSNLSHNKQH